MLQVVLIWDSRVILMLSSSEVSPSQMISYQVEHLVDQGLELASVSSPDHRTCLVSVSVL